MENTGYLSEPDDSRRTRQQRKDQDTDLPNTFHQHELNRADWSTPVGLAVQATTSDFIEEALEEKLDGEFLREGDIIGSDSEISGYAEDPYIYVDNKKASTYVYPRPEMVSSPGVELVCTCPSEPVCTCPRDANDNTEHRRAKYMFKEEHAKKFMCTLKVFSAEKQMEFDSAEDELNHVKSCLSQAMNESVYKVNSVADALIAKINMEREEYVRRITEDGTLALTNMQAQRQFVDDLKRSLQHADDETTNVLGKDFDNVLVRKASNLTDKVRKIQITPTEQYVSPMVIEFEQSSDLETVSIGKLVERPIAGQMSQQQRVDDVDVKKMEVTPKRRPILKFGNGFGRPSSITVAYDVSVNRSGESVAVAAGAGGVLVYNASDGKFLFRFCGPEEDRVLDAKSVAHLSNGHILVVDGKSRDVRVFEAFGRYLRKFGTRKSSKETKEPKVRLNCIIVDDEDNILIGDRRRMVITMHEPDGTKIQTLPTGIEPDFLAVSSKEIIAVSGIEAFEVQLMNYLGQFLLRINSLPTKKSLWPKGICFDINSKYLYIAHYKSLGEKSIHKYNVMTGKYMECVAKNLSGPNGIAMVGMDKVVVADFGCVKIFSVDT